MTSSVAGHGFVPRVEDDPLVRGHGRFVDDDRPPGLLHGCFVRSPQPHARIVGIDVSEAKAADGVMAVLTSADLKAAGIGSVGRHPPMTGRGGAKIIVPFRPALADDRVLHVGQPVALVVATSAALAQDAAERVVVEYEGLAAVTSAADAIKPGAPQLWPEAAGNVSLDWPGPVPDEANAREVDHIIASAPHVARVTCMDQRVSVAPMEPRGATGSFDAASGVYTLRVCSQGVNAMRDAMLGVMGLERVQLRVVTEDVGGAFGLKTGPYPEYPAVLVAAKLLGRPVHWMSTRAEAFLSDNQARDMLLSGELAIDDSGKFLALRIGNLVNLGAFVGAVGAHLATNNFSRCFPGMYSIPRVDVGVVCAFTNTLPTAPYRGAGRPEANYLLEQLVEQASRITGIARDKIRRRNLIPPSAIPYRTAVGTVYDSGDFPAVFDQALAVSGYAGAAGRKRDALTRGRRRGIGISFLLEHSGGTPTESAALWFPGDGTLVVGLGVQPTGQGHASLFARLAAQRLGIPAAQVRVRYGDTAHGIGLGGASVGSRSTMTVGSALARCIETLIDKGRRIAAHVLETAEADIAYRDGVFAIAGTDRRLTLFELADRAAELSSRGEVPDALDTSETVDTPQAFPNGCHVAEVEIDPDTGVAEVIAYTAVDDGGTILDHTLVEGQIHGGIAQGLGQVLMENMVYDANGQLVTGSFMDYAMPRAADMPPVAVVDMPTPSTTNPLGVKGVGEAGTTGALAAIMLAIADAIPGGARLDMPATPEKIWTAMRTAAGGG